MGLQRVGHDWATFTSLPQNRYPMKLTQLIKANHTTFQGWCLLLRRPTLCLWCVFLNKSTSYLSLCLSLNFLCNETSRTWASLSRETRCVISVGRLWVLARFESQPSHMVSQVQLPRRMTWRQARKLLLPNTGLFSVWNRRHSYVCDTTILDFPTGSGVNNLPAVLETQVWSLGREDPLEKEMGTHSSSLAWVIPWTEEPGGLQSMRSQKSWIQHSE